MSDRPDPVEQIAPDPAVPQCSCACHNLELGCARAGMDFEGNDWPNQDLSLWAGYPRYVDRREMQHAVIACPSCKPLHALAFSDQPVTIWREELKLDPPATTRAQLGLGGPHKQCEHDCPYCHAGERAERPMK